MRKKFDKSKNFYLTICIYSTYTSLGLLPLAGQTTPNSSRISNIFAALAYQSQSFLCIKEVEPFLLSFTTKIAFSITSGSSS
ncbi:MAG: hypothetical protein LBD88_03595 [Candidatus Peribacteria bacterium]|nr:hypothetical protein [Candidatus Peribacteria bacterium]